MAINIDSDFFDINAKKRRTLGMLSKSISFRTHIIVSLPVVTVNFQYHMKLVEIKSPLMAVLLRLYILGLADSFLSSGYTFCNVFDQGNIKDMTSEEQKDYFTKLPLIVSFRVHEYEKQIFYLHEFMEGTLPVVTMRHLYHANVQQFNILNYINDDDLIHDLMLGLSLKTLKGTISFQRYQE